MKKPPDMYYQDKGLFVSFIPNTARGEQAWRDMVTLEPTCRFLAMHKSHILRQLKDAGITYGKLRWRKMSAKEACELMDELEDIRKEYKQ